MPTETAADEVAELARVRLQCRSGAAKAIRVASGTSIPDVRRATGASLSAIWRWENGERRPTGEMALRYGRLLESLRKEVGW